MGTNFYWLPGNQPKPCPTCGHAPDQQKHHIGKRSAGWTFTFQSQPDLDVASFADWKRVFASDPAGFIEDEYGDRYTPDDFTAEVIRLSTAPWHRVRDTQNRRAYTDLEGHAFIDDDFS